MEIVQIVGIIFAALVILILAYLYRESVRISSKARVEVEPAKVEFEGGAQQEPDQMTGSSAHKIE